MWVKRWSKEEEPLKLSMPYGSISWLKGTSLSFCLVRFEVFASYNNDVFTQEKERGWSND